MSNYLLNCIDEINTSVDDAFLETSIAISETYMKAACILESVDETTDLSAYEIFQEAPVFGRSNESAIKRILLFIPRLIGKLIKLALSIVVAVIGAIIFVISLPFLIASGKSITNKIDKNIDITAPFNPDFIDKFMTAFEDVMGYVSQKIENGVMFGEAVSSIWNDPTTLGSLKVVRDSLTNFDTESKKETTKSRGEFEKDIKDFKKRARELKRYSRSLQVTSAIHSSEEDKDNAKNIVDFNKILTDCGKKFINLRDYLDKVKKDIKKQTPNDEERMDAAIKMSQQILADAGFAGDEQDMYKEIIENYEKEFNGKMNNLHDYVGNI